jgi:two-component system, LuxR family, response regulator FixJ
MGRLDTSSPLNSEQQQPNTLYYRTFLNRDRVIQILDGDAASANLLRDMLRAEGFMVAIASTLAQFEEQASRQRPDLALLNMDFDGADGSKLIEDIRKHVRGLPIIMLDEHATIARAVAAVKAGAIDVMPKPYDMQKLREAIIDVLRRDIHMGTGTTNGRAVAIYGVKSLTQREREVAELIVGGMSNKEAAQQLDISPRTVEVHRAHVMAKLKAKNTADLMRILLTP